MTPDSNYNPQEAFDHLLSKMVDDSLNREEHDELAQLLVENSSFREQYLQYVTLYAELNRHAADLSGDTEGALARVGIKGESPQDTQPKGDGLQEEKSGFAFKHWFNGGHRVFRRPWLTAAVLFLGVSLLGLIGYQAGLFASDPWPYDESTLAVVEAIDGDATLSGSSLQFESQLAANERIQLTSGSLTIRFESDTELTIEAPASFEVTDRNAIILESGQAFASVSERGIGFTVHTPYASTIDLGTKFGIKVDNATQRVTTEVIEGQVEVWSVSRLGVPQSRVASLDEGDRAIVSRDANGRTIVDSQTFNPEIVRLTYMESAGTRLLLSDLVAGGDGTGQRSDSGLDVFSGQFVQPRSVDVEYATGGPQFVPVTSSSFIDGVFVPYQRGNQAVISSQGHTFDHQRLTDGRTYGPIWSGPNIPPRNSTPTPGEGRLSTVIEGVDFGGPDHTVVVFHPSKGMTFDLEAIRSANPSHQLTSFTCIVGNTERTDITRPNRTSDKHYVADVWALVDGEVVVERLDIRRSDGAIYINIPIDSSDRFLTLISGPSQRGMGVDWIMIGDGAFILEPAEP